MDWVAGFYARQNRWSQCYQGEVTTAHRERAAFVVALALDPGPDPECRSPDGRSAAGLRVLELGAGGGQVAVALAGLGAEVIGIELLPELVEHAARLAAAGGTLTAMTGDRADPMSHQPGAASDRNRHALPQLRRAGLRHDGAHAPTMPRETPLSGGAAGSPAPGAGDVASRVGSCSVLQGDFYTFEPDGAFDLILYLDGFGVGSDDQQRRLLRRIRGWLAPGGCAVLELYTPWYAAMVAGRGWPAGEAERRYGFDADACCWLDRWWPRGQPDEYVEQRLRCYSPADLRLLLEPTGLICDRVVPGGRVDWESHRFVDRAPLGEAMSWFARLTPA